MSHSIIVILYNYKIPVIIKVMETLLNMKRKFLTKQMGSARWWPHQYMLKWVMCLIKCRGSIIHIIKWNLKNIRTKWQATLPRTNLGPQFKINHKTISITRLQWTWPVVRILTRLCSPNRSIVTIWTKSPWIVAPSTLGKTHIIIRVQFSQFINEVQIISVGSVGRQITRVFQVTCRTTFLLMLIRGISVNPLPSRP